MKLFFSKLVAVSVGISVISLLFNSTTFAHVVVKPAEVTTASFQTFTVGVPNEKDIPTTSLKLIIPSGLKYVTPVQKLGWEIVAEKNGNGDDAITTSITWSGNTVAAGFFDNFDFVAQVPAKATDLRWKAYQTYADGTVVSWDKASTSKSEESDTSGPFSVTKVVDETTQTAGSKQVNQATVNNQANANRALIISITAVIVSLVSLFVATRKK